MHGNTFEIGQSSNWCEATPFLAARRSVSCSWCPRSDLMFAAQRTLEQGLMPQITGSCYANAAGPKQ